MSSIKHYLVAAGVVGIVAMVVNFAQATVITPTDATASSHYDVEGPSYEEAPVDTINSTGLVASGGAWDYHVKDPTCAVWTAQSTDTSPWIQWDLGKTYNLTGFHMWNGNENWNPPDLTSRGVQAANVKVSANGSIWTDLGSMTFTQAPGTDTYTGEDYALTAANARYVRFDVLSTFGATMPSAANYASIAEIRFQGTAVPEPSTIVLLTTGTIGLLAYAWRHRK
jgi:hypothetical protein